MLLNKIISTTYQIVGRKFLKKNIVPVLCFHHIGGTPNIMFPPMNKDRFYALMRFYKQHFNLVNFSRLNKDNHAGEKPLLIITFDDGYTDFYHHALPVLQELQIPATLFVITNYASGIEKSSWTDRFNHVIHALYQEGRKTNLVFRDKNYIISSDAKKSFRNGLQLYFELLKIQNTERNEYIAHLTDRYKLPENGNNYLNWEQIKETLKSGIEIGSHTISHTPLTTIHNHSQLINEVRGSKEEIESRLNTKIHSFAFPNGQFNSEIIRISEEAGYKYLFTSEQCLFRYFPERNHYIIPRILISSDNFKKNIVKTLNMHKFFKNKDISDLST